jgi:hypothetical protein
MITSDGPRQVVESPRIATVWLFWGAWAAILIGLGAALTSVKVLVEQPLLKGGMFDSGVAASVWVLGQLAAILVGGASVGVLRGLPALARVAIVSCWFRVAVDLTGALLGLTNGGFLVPLTAFFYGAFAIGLGAALRRRTHMGRAAQTK